MYVSITYNYTAAMLAIWLYFWYTYNIAAGAFCLLSIRNVGETSINHGNYIRVGIRICFFQMQYHMPPHPMKIFDRSENCMSYADVVNSFSAIQPILEEAYYNS